MNFKDNHPAMVYVVAQGIVTVLKTEQMSDRDASSDMAPCNWRTHNRKKTDYG